MHPSHARDGARATQDQFAADLRVGRASIAKLERRADMYLSTLRRDIRAVGGELGIIARFPDQPQGRLRGLGELVEETSAPEIS